MSIKRMVKVIGYRALQSGRIAPSFWELGSPFKMLEFDQVVSPSGLESRPQSARLRLWGGTADATPCPELSRSHWDRHVDTSYCSRQAVAWKQSRQA